MAIDITSKEAIRKLTLKDLVDDAVERKDIEALRYLEDESSRKETKTKADGTTYEANINIIKIRTGYLKKFLNYVPQSELSKDAKSAQQKAKREKEKSDMFATAFKALKGQKDE
ncbi:MAG: hypothetical protein ACOYI8_05660 [Christensenellales bacterium]